MKMKYTKKLNHFHKKSYKKAQVLPYLGRLILILAVVFVLLYALYHAWTPARNIIDKLTDWIQEQFGKIPIFKDLGFGKEKGAGEEKAGIGGSGVDYLGLNVDGKSLNKIIVGEKAYYVKLFKVTTKKVEIKLFDEKKEDLKDTIYVEVSKTECFKVNPVCAKLVKFENNLADIDVEEKEMTSFSGPMKIKVSQGKVQFWVKGEKYYIELFEVTHRILIGDRANFRIYKEGHGGACETHCEGGWEVKKCLRMSGKPQISDSTNFNAIYCGKIDTKEKSLVIENIA